MSIRDKIAYILRKGDIVKLKINSLAAGGEGVSRDLGQPVFVERSAPGDLAEVRLFDVRKDFAKGEIVNLVEPSAVRAEPPCKLFKVCGGCQWQHLTYGAQLDAKADIIRQALKHIGKLETEVLPTLAAQDPLYYRNKVQFPVEQVRGSGRILAGYYKQNSHELVNIKHCPVQPEPLDRMLTVAKELAQHYDISVYDEKSGLGLLRHIAARHSFGLNKVLVTLVLNAEPPLRDPLKSTLEEIGNELMQHVPEVVGVCVNLNAGRGNRIMGSTTVCVAGSASVTEVLKSALPEAPDPLRDGVKYQLSSTSFFQVNSAQAERLLDEILRVALDEVKASSNQSNRVPLIIDAYAGVGTMALWLSTVAEKVIAIEEWHDAVVDGIFNRDLNGISNVEFVEGKVEDVAPQMVAQQLKPSIVVVDPPRKGLHPSAIQSICDLRPECIVYVSCNPATLARDLRILEDTGYKTIRIQPVDMFPQTYHVESVAVLKAVKS